MPSHSVDGMHEAGGGISVQRRQPYLAVKFCIATVGVFQDLGRVFAFGGNFCPRSSAEAAGQLMAISQNSALFSVLGTIFGGDGETTFGLPDLRGRAIVASGAGAGLTPRTIGEQLGTESVTLVEANLPSHDHAHPDGSTSTYAGGAQAISMLGPSLVLHARIATAGTFPSRDRRLFESLDNPDTFLASVTFMATGHSDPNQWVQANGYVVLDGSLIAINSNPALFSLVGTIYGGDGQTTFGVPDARGRVLVGSGTGPGLSPYNLGSSSGTQDVSLTSAQLPSHAHVVASCEDPLCAACTADWSVCDSCDAQGYTTMTQSEDADGNVQDTGVCECMPGFTFNEATEACECDSGEVLETEPGSAYPFECVCTSCTEARECTAEERLDIIRYMPGTGVFSRNICRSELCTQGDPDLLVGDDEWYLLDNTQGGFDVCQDAAPQP